MLNWVKNPYPLGTDESYSAEYPWNRTFGSDGYHIYKWKEGWAFSRPQQFILGELNGQVKHLNDAKSICEDDFAKQVRLRAWIDFMLSTDPPSVEDDDETLEELRFAYRRAVARRDVAITKPPSSPNVTPS